MVDAIIAFKTLQIILPDGWTIRPTSMNNSIRGDEANKRTIMFNTRASKMVYIIQSRRQVQQREDSQIPAFDRS